MNKCYPYDVEWLKHRFFALSRSLQVYNIRISIWPFFNTKKHFHRTHQSNDGAPAFRLSWSLRNIHQAYYAHYVKEHRLIVNCAHKHSNSFRTARIQTWRHAKGEKQRNKSVVSVRTKDLLHSLVMQEDSETDKRLWNSHLFTIPYHGPTVVLCVIQIRCVDSWSVRLFICDGRHLTSFQQSFCDIGEKVISTGILGRFLHEGSQ
jgi:hypothetical protein